MPLGLGCLYCRYSGEGMIFSATYLYVENSELVQSQMRGINTVSRLLPQLDIHSPSLDRRPGNLLVKHEYRQPCGRMSWNIVLDAIQRQVCILRKG